MLGLGLRTLLEISWNIAPKIGGLFIFIFFLLKKLFKIILIGPDKKLDVSKRHDIGSRSSKI